MKKNTLIILSTLLFFLPVFGNSVFPAHEKNRFIELNEDAIYRPERDFDFKKQLIYHNSHHTRLNEYDLHRKALELAESNELFTPAEKPYPSFGFTEDEIWLKTEIEWQVLKRELWYTEIKFALIDEIDFFVIRDGVIISRQSSGDSRNFSNRTVEYKNPVFTLDAEPGARDIVLIRSLTNGSLQIPLAFMGPHSFSNEILKHQMFFGIYYGIILVMILYNFFLYVTIKNKTYFYYILFISIYLIFQANINGLAHQYLWPSIPMLNNLTLPFLILAGIGFAMHFTRLYLQCDQDLKFYDHVFSWAAYTAWGLSLLSLIAPYNFAVQAAAVLVFIAAVLMIHAGSLLMIRGSHPARYYVLSWSALIAGILIYVLKTFNILPPFFFTEYAIQIGSAAEAVLLSLGLGDRIRLLEKEKKEASLKAIETRLQLMEAISRFVPEEFIDHLGKKSLLDVKIGDSVDKDITLLFSDIRGFTSLSENMTAEENFNFLNSYLKRMDPLIRNNRGFIDKFIGDAIMAIFPENPDGALRAAIAMQKELLVYNSHRQKTGYQPVSIGIGLHRGSAMLGTVGSISRMDTTVIGDTVNLAARVESLTKTFRTGIILTDFVWHGLDDPEKYHLREIDSVRVRGKQRPVVLYEALDYLSKETRQHYLNASADLQMGMFFYKAGNFKEAKEQFSRCLELCPDDHLPGIYLRRCDKLIDNPPGQKWSGVSRFK